MLSELSNMSEHVNGPILFVTAICLILLIGITAAMVYFTFRYSRRRNPNPTDVAHHTGLEVAWTVIPTILSIAMFWTGWVGYKYMKDAPADAIQITAEARMWSWSFKYANPGEDGPVATTLNIPVGKAVQINMFSSDVLHSFYIPAFKVKQDCVPGIDGLYVWFEAYQEGEYDILCTEYCGLSHAAMLAKCNVMSVADYDAWYQQEHEKFEEMQELLSSNEEMSDDDPALIRLGQTLSAAKGCIACHSSDGSAIVGPTFKGLWGKQEVVITAGAEREITVDEDYLKRSIWDSSADIVKGYQNLMPSQQGLVNENDAKAIIAYIKSLAN